MTAAADTSRCAERGDGGAPAPRRIAVVSPRLTGFGTAGGAEILLQHLARRAGGAGVETVMLTTCARDHVSWRNIESTGRRSVDGLPVEFFEVDADRDVERFHRLQDRIGRGGRLTASEEQAWLANGPRSAAMRERLRELLPSLDVVLAGPYLLSLVHDAVAIAGTKARLVPCLHDEPFARLRVVRDLFTQAGGVLFNSEPERDLAHRLFGDDAAAGTVVGMAMDPFDARPPDDLDYAYVLYCGRREPLKGTPLLMAYLDVFRRRTGKDVRLVLTGSGAIQPPASLAPSLVDMGFVSEDRKRSLMAGAVAFCHPSVNESFGIVLLEAWLAGVPALVHGRGAVLPWHCRRSGGGLWFDNYPEFEAGLSLLVDQPALRRRLGDAGRRYVTQTYNGEQIDRRLLAGLNSPRFKRL